MAPLNDLLLIYLVLGALLAAAAMLFSAVVARRVVAPVAELGRIAQAISQSGLAEFRVPDSGLDEVGALGRAFKQMLGKLQAAQSDLERLVKERTFELGQKEQYVSSVLDHALDGIVTIDSKGIIETFNRASERIFGYSAIDLIGENVRLLMPEPDRGKHDGYLETYLATRMTQIVGQERETVGQRSDGRLFPMSLAVSELTLNGEIKFIGIIRDISERKQIEKLKNEFLAMVSHELRTPLTSIQGALGLVASGAAGKLAPQMKHLLDIAASNGARLERLVNDILDFQKIESGRMSFKLEPLSLRPLLSQAVEANRAFAAQFGVDFKIQELPGEVMILSEADRFVQVMTNLLSNAVKFSPRGSTVEIRAKSLEQSVRIEVKDKGQGVPEDFKDKIFHKFSQADSSSSRQAAGTGLGLSISKAMVEGMGGIIGYESTPGQGATFYFEQKLITDDYKDSQDPHGISSARKNGQSA